MLDLALLIRLGIEPSAARRFAEPLSAACALMDIDTPRRVAAFLAQCVHESTGFTRLEENLFFTTAERIRAVWPTRVPNVAMAQTLLRNPRALANCVYALRNGNGDEASGDGWAYRGRGLIQLTGRANYQAAEMALNRPYIDSPALVAEPDHAALTSAHWWTLNGCNALADAWQLDAICRTVNGPGMQGRLHRATLCGEFLQEIEATA